MRVVRFRVRARSSDAPARWERALIAATVALAVGCGGGGQVGGDAPPDPPEAQPLVLGLLELTGQPSFLGRTTTKTAVLRHDGTRLEILDFVAGGRSATFDRPVLTFSSPDTAWTVATLGFEHPALLRSDDRGGSWQVAADIPFDLQSILSLRVDSVTTGVLTAWLAVSESSFPGQAGPFVWTRRLEDGTEWTLVPGIQIPPWPYSADARFARSAMRAELLVQGLDVSAFYRLATDPLESQPFTPGLPFQVAGWTAVGERRLLAGEVNDTSDDVLSVEAAVLASDDGVSWQVSVLPGLTLDSHVGGFDFVDAKHGFVCGRDQLSNEHAEAFCFATEDGATSWQRGTIEPPSGGSVADVVRTSLAAGVATLSTGLLGTSVLTTKDGGQSWQNESLPPLATHVVFGVLARSSGAPAGATTAPVAAPTSEPGTTSPSVASPLQANGPIAWAVGDAADRGVAIDGIVLRSDDGGTSWQELLATPGGSFADVDFVDRATGWVVGGGRILRSDDGGATFADQTANIEGVDGPLLTYALAAADGAHAVAGVATDQFAYQLLYTADGGAHWQPATVEPPPRFVTDRIVHDVCLTTGGAGLLTFTSSIELFSTRDGGAAWRPVDPRAGLGDFNDNGFIDAPLGCTGTASLSAVVRGVDDGTVTVWSSQDGGATWSSKTAFIGGSGGAVPLLGSFVAADRAWLAYGDLQNGVTLFGTRDGGASWTDLGAPLLPSNRESTVELPETLALADDEHGMLLTSRFDIQSAAFEHAVLASADGGATWTRSGLPPGFHPLRVDYVP